MKVGTLLTYILFDFGEFIQILFLFISQFLVIIIDLKVFIYRLEFSLFRGEELDQFHEFMINILDVFLLLFLSGHSWVSRVNYKLFFLSRFVLLVKKFIGQKSQKVNLVPSL